MKISIIIPAYNEEKLLPRCLKSILSAKLPEKYEIIVVNNASTDRTAEIAKSFSGVKVVNESKKGITRARQAGFRAAEGDILFYLDADTFLPFRNWFEIAVAKYKNNPDLVGLSGPYHYEAISRWARFLEWIYNSIIMNVGEFIWQKILRRGGIMLLGGNFSVRRWVLQKIGGFNTKIDFYGEDTNLTRRVAKVGKIEYTNALFVYSSPRRFHAEGGVRTATKYAVNFFGEWFFKKPVHKAHNDIR